MLDHAIRSGVTKHPLLLVKAISQAIVDGCDVLDIAECLVHYGYLQQKTVYYIAGDQPPSEQWDPTVEEMIEAEKEVREEEQGYRAAGLSDYVDDDFPF